MAPQLILGALCLLLALWLRPKWKRARARRVTAGGGLRLAKGRAPGELWLLMNVWFSFAVGALLVGMALPDAYAHARRWLEERRLRRFEVRCERTAIHIVNRGPETRWLEVDRARLEASIGQLFEEPEGWEVSVDGASRAIPAGGAARFALTPPAEGPCARPADGKAFALPLDRLGLQPKCTRLSFHLMSREGRRERPEIDATVSCPLAASGQDDLR